MNYERNAGETRKIRPKALEIFRPAYAILKDFFPIHSVQISVSTVDGRLTAIVAKNKNDLSENFVNYIFFTALLVLVAS